MCNGTLSPGRTWYVQEKERGSEYWEYMVLKERAGRAGATRRWRFLSPALRSLGVISVARRYSNKQRRVFHKIERNIWQGGS